MSVTSKCQEGLLLLYYFITFAVCQEPPKLSKPNYESVVHGRLNERIRLTCPVESPSKLLFDWKKDDESITGTWLRFEEDGRHLIIEELEAEDAGIYLCNAINGYGSQQAAIRLIVTNPSDETATEYSNFESERTMRDLNFTEDTYNQPRFVQVISGSSLTLQCSVVGYPLPDLMWFKNEVLVRRADQVEESETLHLPLRIQGATVDSTGNYTCLALGLKERAQLTFTIEVLDAKRSIPDMSEVEPFNNTERRGGTGKLHCWIYSLAKPEAEWFKLLPLDAGQLHPNTSLVVGGHHYQSLESNQTVKKHDGSFLRQLVLHPLDDKHSGCYLCMASNKYGYNIRRTCLTVTPNYETEESKSVPFSTMVALPSGLILSLVAGFVCWLRERQRERRLGAQQTERREALMSCPGSQTPASSGLVSPSTDGALTNYYLDAHRVPRRV